MGFTRPNDMGGSVHEAMALIVIIWFHAYVHTHYNTYVFVILT